MTEQKHTPGPWYIGRGTYEGRNIYSAEAVTDDEGFTYNPVVATAEDDGVVCWDANARLITAAPDLLEALQRLAFASECRDNTSGDAARLIEVKAELAAAAKQARIEIAKATGGSND